MKTLSILNHKLTINQIAELGGDVTELTPALKLVWGQIPAEGGVSDVERHLEPILNLMEEFDQVVCQGEFSAFAVVLDHARRVLDIPVFVACSRRETVETVVDGVSTKTAVFKHVQFRQVNFKMY